MLILLLYAIYQLLGLYQFIVLAFVIFSWLVAFQIVNTRNGLVYRLGYWLERLTEPALRPLRNLLPSFGTLDISPMLLLFAIYFLRLLAIRMIVWLNVSALV